MEDNSFNVTKVFANTLKRLRNEKDLTQHELKDRSGVSLRMISDMERGLKQPTLNTLIKLAKGFDLSPMDLFREFNKDMNQHHKG